MVDPLGQSECSPNFISDLCDKITDNAIYRGLENFVDGIGPFALITDIAFSGKLNGPPVPFFTQELGGMDNISVRTRYLSYKKGKNYFHTRKSNGKLFTGSRAKFKKLSTLYRKIDLASKGVHTTNAVCAAAKHGFFSKETLKAGWVVFQDFNIYAATFGLGWDIGTWLEEKTHIGEKMWNFLRLDSAVEKVYMWNHKRKYGY